MSRLSKHYDQQTPSDEDLFDKVWCYPPHIDDDYRVCKDAFNSWHGTIETKDGDEVMSFLPVISGNFEECFRLAQKIVRKHNKEFFNMELEDYE